MGQKDQIDLSFPLGGLDKLLAYRTQPPFTTPECSNVRPDATFERRLRGGSRPGMAKFHALQCGSAANRPIYLIDQVRALQNQTLTIEIFSFFTKAFGFSTIGDSWNIVRKYRQFSRWADAEWLTTPPILNSKITGSALGVQAADSTAEAGWCLDPIVDLDGSEDYAVTIEWQTGTSGSWNGIFNCSLRMTEDDPDPDTAGDRVQWNSSTGAIALFHDGVSVDTGTLTAPAGATQTMVYEVLGTTIRVLDGVGTILLTHDTLAAAPGHRTGFTFNNISGAGSNSGIANWYIRYTSISVAGRVNRNFPVISAFDDGLTDDGGGIWTENNAGTDWKRVDIDPSDTGFNLADSKLLCATQRAQLLFIADHGIKYDGVGTITHTSTEDVATLTAADGNVFNTAPIVYDHDCLVITDAPPNSIPNGTYEIETVSASSLTFRKGFDKTCFLETSFTTGYRIERRPKVYDPVKEDFYPLYADFDQSNLYFSAEADPLPGHTRKGPVPCDCPLIALYRDRIVLAGSTHAPQAWFMARQGDPYDWYMGGAITDEGRPMAGTTSESGLLAEPITALIVFSDDYMIFGCTDSLWVQHGDPASGGRFDNLSPEIGIVSKRAWCRTPDGDAYIMSRDGMYRLPIGANAPPVSMSREKIPAELLNIDRDDDEIVMAYDINERGFHIYIVPKDGTSTKTSYWYEIETGSFWPTTHASLSQPNGMISYKADESSEACVLFGHRDGYVRRFDITEADDDGTTFTSDIMIGPFRLGSDDYTEGLLTEILATPSPDSGTITWELYVDQTAEDVYDRATAGTPIFATGSWSGGLNFKERPRARGSSCILKLKGTPGSRWAMEKITSILRVAGYERKLG